MDIAADEVQGMLLCQQTDPPHPPPPPLSLPFCTSPPPLSPPPSLPFPSLSQSEESEEDAFAGWYPPVESTLACLSKLYRCVSANIFTGLAQVGWMAGWLAGWIGGWMGGWVTHSVS